MGNMRELGALNLNDLGGVCKWGTRRSEKCSCLNGSKGMGELGGARRAHCEGLSGVVAFAWLAAMPFADWPRHSDGAGRHLVLW